MLDLFNLPFPAKADIQVFYYNSGATTNGWQPWIKPRGKTMTYMLCLSGGSGGGSGSSSAAGSGGTGGGSSSQSTLIIPCLWLPDLLFVQVGSGGAGGVGVLNAAGNSGGLGSISYISADSSAIAQNNIILTASTASGGPGGTISTGTAGTAATATVMLACPIAGLGKSSFLAGQAGTVANDVNNTGTAQTYATTGIIVQGGSGGGAPTGGTATGVAITGVGVFPGFAASAGTGPDGIVLNPPDLPLRFTGGLGGGGGATGFAGGKGSYGCGGGGGGGVVATATSGAGGAGGDGLVIIASW